MKSRLFVNRYVNFDVSGSKILLIFSAEGGWPWQVYLPPPNMPLALVLSATGCTDYREVGNTTSLLHRFSHTTTQCMYSVQSSLTCINAHTNLTTTKCGLGDTEPKEPHARNQASNVLQDRYAPQQATYKCSDEVLLYNQTWNTVYIQYWLRSKQKSKVVKVAHVNHCVHSYCHIIQRQKYCQEHLITSQ